MLRTRGWLRAQLFVAAACIRDSGGAVYTLQATTAGDHAL